MRVGVTGMRCAVVVAAFGMLGIAARSHAQRVIPDAASCEGCSISVQPVVTIGSEDGPGFIASPPESVVVDRQGRYWFLTPGRMPLVFGAAGQFAREVGRLGDGPEEFRDPVHAFVTRGDSIVVLDITSQRASVVSPDLRVIRVARLQGGPWRGHPIAWPDTVLLAGNVVSMESSLRPFDLVGLGGPTAKPLTTLDDPLRSRPEVAVSERWTTSEGVTGSVLVAASRKYQVFRFVPGRGLESLFERRPPWFASESMHWIGNPTTPPPPQLRSIEAASDGRVWVYVRVAADTWREAWSRVPAGAREVEAGAILEEKLYATMAEVIDPATGRVVTSRRLEGMVISALPNQQLALYEVGADGIPRVRIVRLAVVGG